MPESDQVPDQGKQKRRSGDPTHPPAFSIRPEYTITTIYPPAPTQPVRGDPGPGTVPHPAVQDENPAAPSPESAPAFPGPSGESPDWRAALTVPVDPFGIVKGSPQSVRLKNPDPGIPHPQSPSGTATPPDTIRRPGRAPAPLVSERLPHMELPRGKFRTLRRKTGLLFLINDMRDEGFTGYCQVQHPNSPILIVFRQGRILLASYDGLAGNRALEAINAQKYSWVDAMLHDLDEKQIQLAIEFNPSWRITEDPESSFEEPVPDDGMIPTVRGDREPVLQTPGSLALPASEPVPVEAGSEPLPGQVSEVTEPSPSPTLPEPGEDTAWREALTMPVLLAASSPPVPDEHAPEGALPPVAAEQARPGPAISFEPLVADSELFEKERKRVKPVQTAVPEPVEQWRAMTVNRHPNNTI